MSFPPYPTHVWTCAACGFAYTTATPPVYDAFGHVYCDPCKIRFDPLDAVLDDATDPYGITVEPACSCGLGIAYKVGHSSYCDLSDGA